MLAQGSESQECDPTPAHWWDRYDSRASWLEARKSVLGGSDVAALFLNEEGKSCNPYKDAYELYLEKVGLEEQSREETDAMWWGKELEPIIAGRYQRETGRVITPEGHTIYRTAACPYLGTTPDYAIAPVDGFDGPGILSIKNVDLWRFIRQRWDEGELPEYIQIQLQAELAATGAKWGSFGLLIGGNRFRRLDVPRNDDFIELLLERVAEFQERVESHEPPEVTASERTTKALKRLHGIESGEVITLDDEFLSIATAFEQAKKDEKAVKERKDGLYNRLLERIGAASEARFSDGSGYTLKTVNRAGYTVQANSYRELRRQKGGK